MSRARRVFFVLVLLAGLFERGATALTLQQTALDAELAAAPFVADLRIETVQDASDFPTPHFRAEALIERLVRGSESLPDRITIVGAGGIRDSIGVGYSGLPLPIAGEHYRAYLSPTSHGDYTIQGYRWGLVPSGGAPVFRQFSRNRSDGTDGLGSGPFLRWPEASFPIPIAISADDFRGRANFVEAIERAFQHWRDVPGVRFDVAPMGCLHGNRDGNDGINSIHFITRDWPFGSTAIAVTRNYFYADGARAGLILDTDILINGVNYDFVTDGAPGKQDIENVITHEVGHFLGLGHEAIGAPYDFDATMYAFASPGETLKRTLAPNDIAGIRDAYPGQGTRVPWVPFAQLCSLNVGPSCGAVPLPHGAAPGFPALAWLLSWLGALFATGRILVKSRNR